MRIQERLVSDVALLHITGRITLTDGGPAFAETLQRLIQEGRTKIVIDVGDVPYIDSTALGSILRTHVTLTRLGGAVKFLRMKGHVRELFEVTKLLTIFETFDSDAAAVRSMAGV